MSARPDYRKPPPGSYVDRNHRLGLVGCWLFNEGGGLLVHDLAGRGYDGTLTNMAVTDWTIWERGRVLDFIGSDPSPEHINAGNMGFVLTYSLSAWVTADTLTDSYHAIVSRGSIFEDDSNYDMAYRWRDQEGGSWRLVVGHHNSTTLYHNEFLLPGNPEGELHHVVVTWNGSDWTGWQDGVPLTKVGGTDTPGIPTDGGQDTKIGAPNTILLSSDDAFNGRIDNVRVYDRALKSNEIRKLYEDPYGHIVSPGERRYAFLAPAAPPAGRATFNTDARPLGVNAGISRWMRSVA